METSSRFSHQGSSMVQSNFQTVQAHNRSRRSKSSCQADQERLPLIVVCPPGTASFPVSVDPPHSRSLSGILAQERGHWSEEAQHQSSYKGPSHRTISRITNRQQHNQQQGYAFEREGWLGTGRGVPMAGDGWGTQWQQHVSRTNHVTGAGQYQAPLKRTASVRSVRSVGKGMDVLDGASIHSNDPLAEWDMTSIH